MICMGIDPGTAHIGYCVLDGMTVLASGVVTIAGDQPWPVKRRAAETALAEIMQEHGPELVVIERTQATRPKPEDSASRVFSMAVLTQHTEELAAALTGAAVARGAQVVRVSPAGSLAALSLKRGATDRQVAEAFRALFGLPCLVRDHHMARAAGVALRGEAEWRLERARAERAARKVGAA